jgi:hypothetical protein
MEEMYLLMELTGKTPHSVRRNPLLLRAGIHLSLSAVVPGYHRRSQLGANDSWRQSKVLNSYI